MASSWAGWTCFDRLFRRGAFIRMLDRLALLSAASLLIVWFAYPLGVALAALLVGRRRTSAQSDPCDVSIIVASREPVEAIAARIRNCLDSAYPGEHLEVVLGMGPERFAEKVEKIALDDSRVRFVQADSGLGKASSLNAAVAVARGKYLVFTDTYQVFEADTLSRLLEGFADNRVGAISGWLDLGHGRRTVMELYWRLERWLRLRESELHSAIGVTGAVYALRRELWQPLPEDVLLDDLFVPMQTILAGYRVAYEPSAHARDLRGADAGREYARKVRTLTGILQILKLQPAVLNPRKNPVWVQFVFHKLLRLLTPYWILALAAWLLVRGSGWAAAASPWLVLAALVVVFVCMTSRAPWAVHLRSLAFEGLMLQLATLAAGWNGLRGNWRVWRA